MMLTELLQLQLKNLLVKLMLMTIGGGGGLHVFIYSHFLG